MTASLITRLQEGEGADQDLDLAVWRMLQEPIDPRTSIPPYTDDLRGIGYCIALAEKVLPGWLWMKLNGVDDVAIAFYKKNSQQSDTRGVHKDICRAFLIALITAKEASHGQD